MTFSIRPIVLLLPSVITACKSDTGVTQLNSPPGAVITSHVDGDQINEDVVVLLRGYVSDADHALDSLGLSWRVDGAEVCSEPASSDGLTTCEVIFDEGSREVSLEVVDPKGKAASTAITLDVQGTEAPSIELTFPTADGEYYSNELVPFSAQVSDAEDDPDDLLVTWESSVAGVLDLDQSPDSTGLIEGYALLEEAEHAITITVEDTSGKTATASVVIEVGGENTAPRCEIVTPTAGEVFAQGDTVDMQATVTDADDDVQTLATSWSSDVDGHLADVVPTAEGDIEWATSALSVATHTLTLEAEDSRGERCEESVLVVVGTPPLVTWTDPVDGDWIYEDEAAGLEVSVSDGESAPEDLDLTWSSSLDGTLGTDAAAADGTASLSVAGLSTGDHVLTVTAVDPDGLSGSDSLTMSVQACTPTTWYVDSDSDGYGDAATTASQCREPSGYVDDDTDCDDSDGSINPGATDTWYDGVDSDCAGNSDYDRDGDGYDSDDYGGDDCKDNYASINPGATETWYDGTDQDCDDASDYDADVDGYDHDSYGGDDCDDTDRDVNPGATETWYDGDDADCDGASDYDADGDGHDHEDYGGGDCDDDEEDVNPDEDEVCDDGIDNDCDGAAEECRLGGEYDLSDADAILVGESAGDDAGASLDFAGDVNGDGRDDILVGARGEDSAASNAGAAYIVYGPVSGEVDLSSADVQLTGESSNDYTGLTLAGGGDADADGVSDVLIGAWLEDEGATNGGAAYLLLGPLTADLSLSAADGKLVGTSLNSRLSESLSWAGDVNGDGKDDMLAGEPWGDVSGTNDGLAYVVYGPLSGSLGAASADAVLQGVSSGDEAGASVAGVGDTDGDGVDDILVGAENESTGGSDAGAAYLVAGPVSGTFSLSAADALLSGENADDAAYVVSAAGDSNADGYADVLVGAFQEDSAGSSAGMVYLVRGPLTTMDLGSADATYTGESSGHHAGQQLASVGDLDGDGHGDILIGARYEDTGGSNAGSAYLLYGPHSGSSGLGSADASFRGESSGDYAGTLGSAGDADGDGTGDLLIGGENNDRGGSDAGAAYLFYGSGM